MPDSLISIGERAFSDCNKLESIVLPDGLTSIGERAFSGCSKLESIVLPDGLTSIGEETFSDCSTLKSMILLNSLISIGEWAFFNCYSLKSMILPDGLTSIGKRAFSGCSKLESIVLPDSLTSIGEWAFFNCYSLKSIVLPNSLISIGERAFSGCSKLESIVLPDSLTSIGEWVFSGCSTLKSMILPNGLTSIGEGAFYGCHSLKSLVLPDSLTSIGEKAFSGNMSLSLLITPYGNVEINNIIVDYLYLYANSILKDKYSDIDDFLDNNYIKNIMNSNFINKQDAIAKFKNLFYKLRKEFDIQCDFFAVLSLEETKKFNYKIWNEIKNLFNIESIELSEALSEMIAIFGLFESDGNVKNRLQNYKDFINNKNIVFTDNNMSDNDTEIVNYTYYQLKSGVRIPEEFDIDLMQTLTENEMKNIKKLTGNYGKRINEFVKANYEIINTIGYRLKENTGFNQEGNFVNFSLLHRMFDGCDKNFDVDFYNFLMKYMDTILKNEIYQRNLKDIQKNFKSIKRYYKLCAGTDKITLKQAINYIENMEFDNIHEGNIEFSKDVKRAGVVDQQAFEYYQNIFELNNERRLSSLVKRSNIYFIDGYKIKAELLRKDDSFGILVGEANYTNCCQIYNGIGHNCLAHAVSSSDGGIFVTKLITDDDEILLTESWDWQNNNVYCHDNIEATPYFKSNQYLRDVVAKAIKLDALEIIRKSEEEVKKYVIERRKKIENSLLSKLEKEKQLAELEKREVIRLVTVGSGNSDLELSNYYLNTINVTNSNEFNNQTFTLSHFQPINYNQTQVYFNSIKSAYSDAKNIQYIIAGSVEELYLGKLEPLVPIYRDERRIVKENKENIRDYTLHKIKVMEETIYPENMQLYVDESNLEGSYIILGEDWYLVYEERDNNNIYISDLARTEPNLEDEKKIQNKEIMASLKSLLETYDVIESDLKEDTSYLLYLMNKKLGYVEQIGEDVSYPFIDRNNTNAVSEVDQADILKNIKQIRQNKNPNLIMHHVKFKKKDKQLLKTLYI